MRTKGVGPRGLGVPNASPLKQTKKVESEAENRNLAPPPENPGGKGLRKMTNQELLRRDITKQNDSLRKLPKIDKNHLPTFDTNTDEGSDAQKEYYSDKNNLKRLRKLAMPIRKKYGY
tara:strand:+ start:1046 stop:1399 length:354 start_codon:yes stop_codon:yes gene_type:complete